MSNDGSDHSDDEEESFSMVREATNFFLDRRRDVYINSVLEHIGGFEKWSQLNNDCQRTVVKFLDYKSRCQLAICSKIDYDLVNSVPMNIHGIGFSEEYEHPSVKVCVEFEKNSNKKFELIFEQSLNDTEIKWTKYSNVLLPEKHCIVIENSKYYEESVKFVEKWMKKCCYGVSSVKVGMDNYPLETSHIKDLPNCRDVMLNLKNENSVRWWLNKMPHHMHDLHISPATFREHNEVTLSPDILTLPQITNCEKLYLYHKTNISNEQFFELKAKKYSFNSSNITDEAINKFIKNWINGKSVEGFKEAFLWQRSTSNTEEITKGIEIRPWNEQFQRENAKFWSDFSEYCYSGRCYQISSNINPYNSMTLNFINNCVSIHVTGLAKKKNGMPYTKYVSPKSYTFCNPIRL